MLTVLLAACTSGPPQPEPVAPDSGGVVGDTGQTGTADSGDTGDTGAPDDTGETGGTDTGDTAEPLEPAWLAVSAGSNTTCGIRVDESIECWGRLNDGLDGAPAGAFRALAMATTGACALDLVGEVHCWGKTFLDDTPPAGPWESLRCGASACAVIDATGALRSFGSDTVGYPDPPDGKFLAAEFGAGPQELCAVRDSGELICWTEDGTEFSPLSGTFVDVAVGGLFGCGLDAAGGTSCWSYFYDATYYGADDPPELNFVQFDLASWGGCGVSVDHELACWGEPLYFDGSSRTAPPEGDFVQTDVGSGDHACGLTTAGQVLCWGNDHEGKSTPPL